MAAFIFSGRDAEGRRISGTRQAASADLLAADLLAEQITPLEIRAERTEGAPQEAQQALQRLLGRDEVSLEQLIMFARQMHSLCKAGVPLVRALGGLAETATSPLLAAALRQVSADIESGRALTQALASQPAVFSTLFVAMVRVGENTGRLDQAFIQVAAGLELERQTRQRIRQATRYPLFVLSAMAVALVVINWLVIPAFAGVFENARVELPLMTRWLIGFSSFMQHWWWLLIGLVLASGWLLRSWLADADGAREWDRLKLRLPLAGELYRRIMLARFTRSFAMMYSAGLPLLQILMINAQAVGNRHLAAAIDEMRQAVERGETLSRAAAVSGLFSPLVLQMLAVGEESGALDSLFVEVADFYDQEVDYSLRRLADSIEPVLISVLAVLVLIVALGVLLPMWDMTTVVKGGQ